jgi:lipase chaperone LimK
MKGVKFVIDENGEQSAVLIDLKENAELWEDFYDAYVAREREGEPRESLEEVRQKLQVQGKASRA